MKRPLERTAEASVRPITNEEFEQLAKEKAATIERSFSNYAIAAHCNMEVEFGTQSEYAEIRACASWAIDALLRAEMLSPVHGCSTSSDRVRCATREHSFSVHDFTHALASVIDSGQPVPSFVTEPNQTTNKKLIADEVHAYHFWREYSYPPLFLCLTSDKLAHEWAERFKETYKNITDPTLQTRVAKLAERMLSVDRTSFGACYALFLEVVVTIFEIETLAMAKKGVHESEIHIVVEGHRASHAEIRRDVLAAGSKVYRAQAERMFIKFKNNDPRAMFDEWLAASRKGNRLHP